MWIIVRSVSVAVGLALVAACSGGSSAPSSSNNNPPTLNPPPTGGLDQRPMNVSCVAPSRNSGAGATIDLAPVFTNLSFNQPLAMLQAPGDSSRWFVVERPGVVRVFDNDVNVSSLGTFIDIRSRVDDGPGEAGLLGMAFHPDFSSNREVFLSYTEPGLVSVVSRFVSLDGGLTLDPASEQVIIRLNQDFGNHNGGNIAFGPDGFLYIGFGDGGSGGDPNSRAQDTTNLLGAMLRLDVDAGSPYAIPGSNPFAGPMCTADPNLSAGNCPEIYAWGLRNPWRWSFDSATGALWLGDVGQNAWEEVDRIELGGNYGWDCREGTNAFGSPAASCSTAAGLIDPVHEYSHSLGSSITGGYVYRGAALPALHGSYLFGDFGSGRIWRVVDDGAGGYTDEELLDTNLGIASFGEGNDGELYVIDIFAGNLYRIVDGGGAPPAGPSVPSLLSASGCVSAQDPSQPAPGLIPYDVAAPFWSDGASKQRWLAIPDGTAITVGPDGDLDFPNGTVLTKHFRLNAELVETRLFMRHPDGEWAGYSYEWDAQQTDATLVQGGKVVTIGGQDWIFPSGNECLSCHTAAAGFSLGLETAQLNRDLTYTATGRTANQLATLDAVAMFSTPLGDPSLQPALADPADTNAPLDERARAYLHTNCAQCHQQSGPTSSSMDLLFGTSLDDTNACDVAPQSGDLGLGPSALIVAPGDPDNSVLLERMNRRDVNAMPPLASNEIDMAGAALVRAWITSLTGCM